MTCDQILICEIHSHVITCEKLIYVIYLIPSEENLFAGKYNPILYIMFTRDNMLNPNVWILTCEVHLQFIFYK